MALNGATCRVFIGDVDISRLVRGVAITAEVNSLVTAKVEFICGVSFVDGVVRLDGPAQAGPIESPDTAPLKIRGMTLTGDIGT